MSELILGPLWGLQNEEEGQHQEVPLGPNQAGGQARHRAQRTPRHLWPRWGQPTTPHLSTSLWAQEKPQALAQRHGGGHIDSIWSLLACQQGPVASLLRPGVRGEGMGSGPRALCLMRAPALCVYLTPRALGHFLSRTESKVPTPCRLCVASTNIAAQIQPLGCLLYVTHSPRAGAGRQRGGDAGRDRQKPPALPGWSTAGCWKLSSGRMGLCPQRGATSAPLASQGAPSSPQSQPRPGLISQRQSWARAPPSPPPRPRT